MSESDAERYARLEGVIADGIRFARPMRHIKPYCWQRCETCGRSFHAASINALYCSPECTNAARAARRRYQREAVKCGRRCALCAAPLPTTTRADTVYCGPACRQAAYRERYASRTGTKGIQSQSRNT